MSYQFDFQTVMEQWPIFLRGAWVTVQMILLAILLGFIGGTLCAIGRGNGPAWLRKLLGAYVEVIRNTPLLIQAYFLIFGLASSGVRVPILMGATIALVVNISAYTSEIMRAGMDAIHPGQIEAADCLGLSRWQIYLHVILQPAMEKVYPALASQYVLLMLGSSILSAVGVEELFGVSNRVQSLTYRNFEVFVVLGAIYLALALLLKIGFALLGMLLFPRQRKLGNA
ncbi:amino acid ABC transporter permease [Herbaspirillum sp. NPDC087042]|uniref:amino acid ABC transporter permease n=1 Tax=Herbaspirillum sp. NPDC087042 TaxID=3364004 RepID=UPI0038015D98